LVNTLADQIRDLAANIGIQFKTPEEFFLNEEPERFIREFDPVSFLAQSVVSGEMVMNPIDKLPN
jgi:hypothetical protein